MRANIFSYGFLVLITLILFSCGEDDLKKASSINLGKVSVVRDTTTGVDIIYSDSARVKAKGDAPLLIKVTPSNANVYQEMPKGIKIDFFNEKGEIDGHLVCDYAIRKDSELKTEFRKNVVVKSAKGDTFSSEELIWDEQKKIFYSNQRVFVKGVDGNIGNGVNFKAPQDFSTYEMETGSGVLNMKEGITP